LRGAKKWLLRPFCLLLLAASTQAQLLEPRDSNVLGWYAYLGRHRVASGWDVHLEGQWRRSDVVVGWQQLLVRPAIVYNVNRQWSVGAGYAYSRTYPYGAFPDPYATPEHRVFQQASAEHDAGEWRIGHRVRLEQRFQDVLPDPPRPQVDRWRYQNRGRYELSARRSLSRSFYLQTSVEPSVRFGLDYRGRAVDQIQTFIAFGRRVGENWRVETGYSHQYGVPRTGIIFESNHTFQIRIHSSVPLDTMWKTAGTRD
jgi:hypothetical protein